jgi:hypothetical protein
MKFKTLIIYSRLIFTLNIVCFKRSLPTVVGDILAGLTEGGGGSLYGGNALVTGGR